MSANLRADYVVRSALMSYRVLPNRNLTLEANQLATTRNSLTR
jgi:hypothetical protein